MSDTTVNTTKVVAVLLADGWHQVIPGSFSVGALGFGAEADPGVLGFRFEEADTTSPYRRPGALAGPLGSILAVRQVTSAARHLGEPLGPGIRYRGYRALEAVPRQAALLVELGTSEFGAIRIQRWLGTVVLVARNTITAANARPRILNHLRQFLWVRK